MQNFTEVRKYFEKLGIAPNLIFDGSSSMIRMGHHRLDQTNPSGQPNGALHGLLLDLKNKLGIGGMPFNNVYVVFDRGGSARRKSMNKEYKAQRSAVYSVYMTLGSGMADVEAKASWYRQQDRAIELMDAIGVKGVYLENVEGDDIISWLSNLAPCVIVSPDGDFHQLLSSVVTIYDPNKKAFLTLNTFQELTLKTYKGISITPRQVLLGKALVGDKSDNLKGVPQLGWKRVGEVITEGVTTLEKALEGDSKYVAKVEANVDLVKANLKIMDLSSPQISVVGVNTLMAHVKRKCECNLQKFWTLCGKEGLAEFVFDQSFVGSVMKAKGRKI